MEKSMMSIRIVVFSLLFSYELSLSCLAGPVHGGEKNITVTVEGIKAIAKTEDSFVCATLDWWPPGKCNYGQCPWGKAGILNLDLDNKILRNAIKAFNPLRIRVGGSIQDRVLYDVGHENKRCPSLKVDNGTDSLFNFTEGCLTMKRWDQLNNLFTESHAIVTFGLNALSGRKRLSVDGLFGGNWNPNNARDLINYTISKGYNVDSWEFGNELCGHGVGARVDPEQYGKDMITLRNLIDELYKNSSEKPKLLGPGGFFDDPKWYETFLQVSGPNVLDGLTHHIYNLGPGSDPNLIYKTQNPYLLDEVAQVYKDIMQTIHKFGPWASAWVGESGGAFNSGGKDVSHTFANSFWYVDQLGMASTLQQKVFCRQTLIGGNYGLLNTTSFVPNPDYYSALLWHQLMGPQVLLTIHRGSPYLRAYSHCSKTEVNHLYIKNFNSDKRVLLHATPLLGVGFDIDMPFGELRVDNDRIIIGPTDDRSHNRIYHGTWKLHGIAVALINMSNSTTFSVRVAHDKIHLHSGSKNKSLNISNEKSYREEYHLSPKDGNIRSDVVLLNGSPLVLTESLDIPPLHPIKVDASSHIKIAPQSIVFAILPDFKAPACSEKEKVDAIVHSNSPQVDATVHSNPPQVDATVHSNPPQVDATVHSNPPEIKPVKYTSLLSSSSHNLQSSILLPIYMLLFVFG